MHHLCWAIKEGTKGKKRQVPCGRLLSEIFHQGGLLETLKKFNLASDRVLGTTTGKIINGKTLQNMKIFGKFSSNEKDLIESSVPSGLMRDFPRISKEDNPKVLTGYIVAHAKESGATSQDVVILDSSDDASLRVKGKRTKVDTDSEAAVAKAKKQKVAKSEATNCDSVSASTPKRKRGKGDSSITNEAAKLALEEMDAEEQRARKRQPRGVDFVCPMFELTPEMASRAEEHVDKLTADKKKKAAQYIAERDEKLKALGQGDCDKYYVDKLAEVKAIADEVEQEAVKEAQEVLKKVQGTSEASASRSVQESVASETERIEAFLSAKVTQIPDPPINITPSSSPSTDSDQDNIPLSQKFNISKPELFKPVYPAVLQSIGEMSQRRVDLCNKLPANHPFQPPIIEPLNMIPVDTQTSTSDQSHLGSPSNLFSLEKHLGGEISITPQKTTKSVPKKIDLVNQQPPKPSQQNNPEQTSLQTKT